MARRPREPQVAARDRAGPPPGALGDVTGAPLSGTEDDDTTDTTALRDAHRALLDAAATLSGSGSTCAPPAGGWNADQVLAHIALVDAATLAAACSIAAGSDTTYDNRASLDTWTIERTIARAGGSTGLQDRIRLQGEALRALAGQVLSEAELDTVVPTLLLSGTTVLVDQPVPLRALVAGLAEDHLPRHTAQLLALRAAP